MISVRASDEGGPLQKYNLHTHTLPLDVVVPAVLFWIKFDKGLGRCLLCVLIRQGLGAFFFVLSRRGLSGGGGAQRLIEALRIETGDPQ